MISSHVLDTALGTPARGVLVRFDVLEANGEWRTLARGETDADGRVSGFHGAGTGERTYRLGFDTRYYFENGGRPVFFPWVELVFVADAGEGSHHVPLLLSPFGYSTYRGS